MKNKPALKALVFFGAGLVAGRFFDPPVAVVLFVSTVPAALAFACWYADKRPALLSISLAAALALAGLVRYELVTSYFSPDHISHFMNHDGIVAVRGIVAGYPERRLEKVNFTLSAHEIYFKERVWPTHGKILISLVELDTLFEYGDELVVRGKLRQPKDRRNPGEFDYREFLLAQGIHGSVMIYHAAQIKKLSSNNGSWFLREVVFPSKNYLEKFIRNNLPAQEAALLSGLLIGERGEIPVELRGAFAKLGVIHILAVSGMHVGFIMIIFMGVMGFLRLPPWLRVALTILALMFYAHVTNLKPPVVRASIMGGLLLFGTLLERKTNVYNTLALAALFILILNPLELFQAGFQLSFSAVFSIVYFYPKLRGLKTIADLLARIQGRAVLRYPLELALVSAAAFLGTLPFTLMYFNRLPNFALAANLVVIPLAFLGLANGLVAAVFNLIMPALAKLYLAASWFFLHTLIHFVEWASALPFAQIAMYRFSLGLGVGYFMLLVLIFNFNFAAARRWLIIFVLCLANYFVWQGAGRNSNELTVTFLDVGQGDAALIRFPNGKKMLIDGGPRGRHADAGAWVIAPYLQREGIHEIDALVLSHTDADHLGGFPFLMRNFKVREVWDNGVMKDTQLCREYLGLIDSLNITRRVLRAGAVVDDFSPVKIFVLHPTENFLKQNPANVNEASLSLKLSYGEIDFIFMGDVETAGEQAIPKFGDLLASEVLKVSHHGSRTSSSEQILNLVRPQLAAISVGELNKFEHPHDEVLARLRFLNSRVLRTDRHSAILLKSDGKTVEVVNWK